MFFLKKEGQSKKDSFLFFFSPSFLWWSGFFLASFVILSRKLGSPDLWWHLSTGQYLWENGSYPPAGFFSFAELNSSAHLQLAQWGDLFFYGLYRVGGLFLLQALGIFAALGATYLLLKRAQNKKTLWTLGACVLLVLGSCQKLVVRKALFGFIFFTLLVHLWLDWRKKGAGLYAWRAWAALGIFGLWSELHGSVLVGAGFWLLVLVGEGLDFLLRKQLSYKAFVFALCIGAGAIFFTQSWGLKGLLLQSFSQQTMPDLNSPTETKEIEGQDKVYEQSSFSEEKSKETFFSTAFFRSVFRFSSDAGAVGEYLSPFSELQSPWVKALFLLLGCWLCFLPFWCWQKKFAWGLFLPALGIAFLSLGYLRTTAYAFLLLLPWMTEEAKNLHFPPKALRFLEALIFMSLINWIFFSFLAFGRHELESLFAEESFECGKNAESRYSPELAYFVLDQHYKEAVWNSDLMGGYLSHLWFGRKRMFMDGRSIIYAPWIHEDYRKNFSQKALARYDMDYAFLNVHHDLPYANFFFQAGWQLEAYDGANALLTKRPLSHPPLFIGKESDLEQGSLACKNSMEIFLWKSVQELMESGQLKNMGLFLEQKSTAQVLSARYLVQLKGVHQLLAHSFGNENFSPAPKAWDELMEVFKSGKEISISLYNIKAQQVLENLRQEKP